jgi:serine/threonine protein kinase
MSDKPTIDSIFCSAIEIESTDERRALVEKACGEDLDLKHQVERLLHAHFHGRSILDAPVQPVATVDEPLRQTVGTVIGPYKLLQQIGEGGMGTVFMAEQTEPVRRMVALKIIKPGMDSRQVIARFEAERQALALMDHVNIARVFDGGTTDSLLAPPGGEGSGARGYGRPYFVMELVHGVPITKYCDDNHLTPRERLELFVPVCQAIQHAHQKGIIHRDIKPSNVMVTLYDGQPVPKVIDFGVAKATEQKLTERTLFTQYGTLVGTLEYMSPEQAEMSALGVDTRSDIYSLGVLLYELLTGSTPLTHKRMKEAAYAEILRMIKEEEPPKPSTRLSESGEALASISAQRHMEPAKLTKLVRGELDWIVMKCLEKDRNRRYETANGFAMDVQRYLADEPVLAGPPSAWYRLRKFARRHRPVLTAVAAFILLLVTAVVALTIALVAVNRERQEKVAALEAEGKRRKQTRAALDAMSSQIIEEWLAKQAVLLPQHKKFLEQALRDYEEFAADTGQQEESRAGVANAHARVGYIRAVLGERKEAEAAWQRARDLYAGLVADFPGIPVYRRDLARVHLDLAIIYAAAERGQEAQAEYDQCLRIERGLVSELPDVPSYRLSLAKSLTQRGIHLKNSGRPQEAEDVYKEALALLKQLVADHPREPAYRAALGGTLGDLGTLLYRGGRSREAVLHDPGRSREAADAFAQAVEIFQQLAADHPTESDYRERLAMHQDHLAGTLADTGRDAEAEESFLQALKTRRQLVSEFPGKPVYREGLALTLNNYGILLKNTERATEAEKLYGDALAIHKQLIVDYPEVTAYHDRVAAASVNLARLFLARRDADAARRLLEDAEPHIQAALKANPRHPRYRNNYRLIRWRLAETRLELRDHAGAAVAAGEFLQAEVEPPRDAYTAAGLFAGCVRLAAQDERLTADKRQELAKTYGDRALSALRQAIDKGAKEVGQMAKDPSLDPLRSRADFQKLLADVKAKNKP